MYIYIYTGSVRFCAFHAFFVFFACSNASIFCRGVVRNGEFSANLNVYVSFCACSEVTDIFILLHLS